ncbi:hypothetical protein ASG22_20400 [Chryseobacterium sp. Leaf405]|uniref:hypothetical protein n=1 Tax=Chryseobacterium sp. Leaf405 TaxID=1736367 RepID=UPI0006F6B074|nr:hypothetical protein [Chryseobacterium sp. Leaf405]KQT27019.1 hypothetical protein ASG22_20400 [Chryseobacterium sp. Leaf405]
MGKLKTNQSKQELIPKNKIMTTITTTIKNLNVLAQKVLMKQIEIIKNSPENSSVNIANKSLLNFDDSTSVWAAGGSLEAAGLAYYGVSCTLDLTNFTNVKAVDFSAHGWGAVAAAIECEVVGAFVVDPSTVAGKCKWVIVAGALEEGAVSLTLMTESGSLIGTFTGLAEGVGAFTWGKDNGELKVIA